MKFKKEFSDLEDNGALDIIFAHLLISKAPNDSFSNIENATRRFYTDERKITLEAKIKGSELVDYERQGYYFVYNLNPKGREILVKHKSYSNWIKYKEEREESWDKLQWEKLRGEVDDIRNKIFDYDWQKRRITINERLTYGAVGIALIALIGQLLCNKPN